MPDLWVLSKPAALAFTAWELAQGWITPAAARAERRRLGGGEPHGTA
jgi:hypothetical protein